MKNMTARKIVIARVPLALQVQVKVFSTQNRRDTRERNLSDCKPTELYVEEVKAAILRQRHYQEKINNSRLKKELLMVSLEREKLALEKERFILEKLREEGGKNARIVVGFGDDK
ncbi:hypothetical protein TELCIR_07018 [Teladorsagia circumcincta]|uniref:Uncharacterized protein n=1 Tax=Teladorsagia circumcincta TaxID=45464 RepID=A0A2G9UMZ1_TELCI|nr:hypothetical protein TELCIR_07018 [Teladorsagia circumcincta]